MIGRTLLHHEITAELGAGAMDRVYLARDTHTGRRVALKMLAGWAARARLERSGPAAGTTSRDSGSSAGVAPTGR
jgi:hypothetical protein